MSCHKLAIENQIENPKQLTLLQENRYIVYISKTSTGGITRLPLMQVGIGKQVVAAKE